MDIKVLIRRRWFAAVLLVGIGVQSSSADRRRGAKLYPDKETSADMTGMSRVFVGWVDLNEDGWPAYGYSSKDDWSPWVKALNTDFVRLCQVRLSGFKTVVGARGKGDENPAGYDLYIKFSDVLIDYNKYHLYLSIHFIDPKTNTEIGSLPARPYFGNHFGFVKYLKAALDEASQKIKVEVTGGEQEKKGKAG